MKLNLQDYAKPLENFEFFTKKYPDPMDAVSNFSLSTCIPLVVVCTHALNTFYIGNPKLLEMRSRLFDFYGYTEVR